MTLALSIADNIDGSGATCTITGSDSGTTNTLYTVALASYTPTPTVPLWSAAANRTGDGTVTLPNIGYYFAYCQGTVNSQTAFAPPQPYLASISGDAVLDRCMSAMQGKVRGLSLLGGSVSPPGALSPGQVYVKAAIDLNKLKVQLPAVFVTPGGTESVEGMVSGMDDIGYPIAVTIVDRWSSSYTPPAATYYKWREQIFRALRFQRLPGVNEVYTVKPEPRAIVEWKTLEFNTFYSGLLFRAISREGRGA